MAVANSLMVDSAPPVGCISATERMGLPVIRILGDLFRFAVANKKLWLLPLLLVLVLVGSLLLIMQNSVFAPFVYTLF